MDILKKTFQAFIYSVAGITMSSAIFITVLLRDKMIPIALIWEIMIMSLVCALGNFIYTSRGELTKRQMRVRIACHYLYINLVVFGGAYLWGWMTPGLIIEFLVMLLLIAVVYVCIMIAIFRQEERMAKSINQRLRKRYPAEEEGKE